MMPVSTPAIPGFDPAAHFKLDPPGVPAGMLPMIWPSILKVLFTVLNGSQTMVCAMTNLTHGEDGRPTPAAATSRGLLWSVQGGPTLLIEELGVYFDSKHQCTL